MTPKISRGGRGPREVNTSTTIDIDFFVSIEETRDEHLSSEARKAACASLEKSISDLSTASRFCIVMTRPPVSSGER